MQKVDIYDTTLRDGSQGRGISFSVNDKLKIVQRFDEVGIDYIEGGWPGSNPKDEEFFRQVKNLPLKNSIVTAFGSTRKADIAVEDDLNLKELLAAETKSVALFGKSWDLHVLEALQTTLEENLAMIEESVTYMKKHGREVIYDAEHFFDGYRSDPRYALETLKAAQRGGADKIILCDTNGGVLPLELQQIIYAVKRVIGTPLGIHAHDDSGVAVANSIIAVEMGITQVQGTINGYGERCGNANLCTLIPSLKLKLGIDCIGEKALKKLTKLSRFVAETANMLHQENYPYVGNNAFSHKGGIHVDAVMKKPTTYEHVEPSLVGNKRKILISELSGKSGIVNKAGAGNVQLGKNFPETKDLLEKLKQLEYQGYQFEGAEASFELLIWKAMKSYKPLFALEAMRVITEKRNSDQVVTEATVKFTAAGETYLTAAEGNGPVNALDHALRKALEQVYPELKAIQLMDYKVRVIDGKDGTGAKVRVLIESRNPQKSWSTVGVSANVIEASWVALVDSLEYGLMCRQEDNFADFQEDVKKLKALANDA